MCSEATLNRIIQTVRELPEARAAEVLDFAEFLKVRQKMSLPDASGKAAAVAVEDHAAWCERLRYLVESQPMTEGDTVLSMRQGARY